MSYFCEKDKNGCSLHPKIFQCGPSASAAAPNPKFEADRELLNANLNPQSSLKSKTANFEFRAPKLRTLDSNSLILFLRVVLHELPRYWWNSCRVPHIIFGGYPCGVSFLSGPHIFVQVEAFQPKHNQLYVRFLPVSHVYRACAKKGGTSRVLSKAANGKP